MNRKTMNKLLQACYIHIGFDHMIRSIKNAHYIEVTKPVNIDQLRIATIKMQTVK